MQSSIILTLNARMASSSLLTIMIPILSDIFVFSYPLYLIYLYFFSHDKLSRRSQLRNTLSNRLYKYQALTIFFWFVWSILINYIVKFFVEEQRPYQVINLLINPKESLILNSIPTDSFPSDHAAVGMVIALSVLIIWYRTQDKKKIAIWRLFLVFALIMDISRITIGVHRPLDIMAWSFIGAGVAIIITLPIVYQRLTTTISDPLITIQEWIFEKIAKILNLTNN